MLKILIYGGCHALVLRDLLAEALGDRVDCRLLINFHLIQAGQPFPYDLLDTVDVVAFSPIENKDAYNTVHLLEACRRRGLRAIVFPWLEWHGYCPGAIKGIFKGRYQWHYHELSALAQQFDAFDTFCDHVTTAFPDDRTIDRTLEQSSAMLKAAEERCAMTIRVSDYVLDHYREERLFLISDHPSFRLYMHVLRQLVAQIGIVDDGALDRLETGRSIEPQWRWRTPILPRVAARIGLAFADPGWLDDELVPGRRLDLRTYLGLYFYRDSVILGPNGAAPLFLDHDDGSRSIEMADGATRLFADPLAGGGTDGHDAYTLLEALSGDISAVRRQARFGVHPGQWRTTWHF